MSRQKSDQISDAICKGQVDRIRQFLTEGVDPNGEQDTPAFARPLNSELVEKQFQIAEILFEAGAKPRYASDLLQSYIEDPEYDTWIERIIDDAVPEFSEQYQAAFTDAVGSGRRELAEKLWRVCPAPREFASRRTPLCEAIRTDNEQMALWMIELGFDHACCSERETPPVVLAVIADLHHSLSKLLALGESAARRVHGHQTVLLPGPPLYKKLRYIREFPKNDKYEIFHEGSSLQVCESPPRRGTGSQRS